MQIQTVYLTLKCDFSKVQRTKILSKTMNFPLGVQTVKDAGVEMTVQRTLWDNYQEVVITSAEAHYIGYSVEDFLLELTKNGWRIEF